MPADMGRDDERWMAEALALAARARGLTSPNPMVGAVVVQQGAAVGRGFHTQAGAPHAEVEAIREARERARGATLYVTLEPCNHAGRTPPCTEAIVAAGIRRVVAATADPNRRVSGGGAAALRRSGVDVALGCLEGEARILNRVYFAAMECLRSHVTLKCAMSADGKIAAFDRAARWITGDTARRETHRLRSECDAIVIGIGTALADDPALTVRTDPPWPREPLRVVVDSRARLPVTARLIGSGAPGRAVVAVGDDAPPARVEALASRGVTVLQCKSREGRVDIPDLGARLFALDVQGVLLEGGSELCWAFLEADLVDRVAMFVAPMLLGGAAAPTAVGGRGWTLDAARRLRSVEIRRLGDDWLIEADVVRPGGSA